MAFLHEGAPCGMSSLRSDTLTMRVTGVRITVFCSAIVIDVIVHCHTAGALFWVKRQKTIVPIIVWLGFDPFRQFIITEVDLGEPTSFLDHVFFVLNENVKWAKKMWTITKNMFESRISAGAVEKLPETKAPGKPETSTISSWSYDMEGHVKTSVERYCEFANRTTQQLHTVATPCMDDHQFKEEEVGSVGELSKVCSQIVLKCLYLARIGRLDILWSVNKLADAITKWTRACDKRAERLISYIHHTCDYRYC